MGKMGLERKSCERCRKLKCKCDNSTPCGACASHNSPCLRLTRKRPRPRSIAIVSHDELLPDWRPLLHDLFSALNRPRLNDWTLNSSCSLHRLLATPTLSRVDPLEAHRLTLVDHLQDTCWLTLPHLRRCLIAFFRHCHRHLPVIHLPTWDVATIPTSLLYVQVLMGSLYLPDGDAQRTKRAISEAFTLIFKLDEGFKTATPSIESMQALCLLISVAGWYVTVGESRQVRKLYNKIVTVIRDSGLHRPIDNNANPDWEQWVYEEKRRRAMSLFYMLDCGFVMFFGDRPRFAPYEIQHCLPSHEYVYQASTASEFTARFVQTNQRPFPELLDAVLSPFQEFPADISAAGHFMLLHGIHAAIWTLQHNESDLGFDVLALALKKWRCSWFSTRTIRDSGFFDEGNFKWWMVANWILHKRAPVVDNDERLEDERVATVYRILKACHLVKTRGIQERRVEPEELLESLPGGIFVNDGLDTLTKEFMITVTK